jgi:signal transduction histidine kinase
MGRVSLASKLRGRHSLFARIIVTLSIVGFFGLLFGLGGILRFVHNSERAVWLSRQSEVARAAAGAVEGFLDQVRSYLSLVGELERATLEENPQILTELLTQNQALLEVVRVDEKGDVFAHAHRTDAVLSNLFTIPQSSWFLRAHEGQSYTGDVQISARGEPYVILAVPTTEGGGVVAARLQMGVLWEVVSDIHFGETGRAYVVNRKGEVIAHPDMNVGQEYLSISDRPEMEAALVAPQGRWSGVYRNFEGEMVLGYTVPIGESDWLLFTEVTRFEAQTYTRQAVFWLGSGGLILALLDSVAITLLLRRFILRPMAALRDGAERLGQGELDHRISMRNIDEIGQVASAFNDMAARLEERTRALAQARDEALAASRFKSRLLANVSHDLRTPLSGILGYAEMMREGVYGELTDRQRQVNERIIANGQRLIALIERLIDQARIESGDIAIREEPFNSVELLEQVEAIVEPLAVRKGLELHVHVDPGLPEVLIGDVQRVRQVLTNLIDNAIKFTERGSVGVHLYADEDEWVIEVQDTGEGIAPQDQLYIFEPFRRVDDSTTRDSTGVGLGLSIVYQLVTLMEGEIDVFSEVGEGSTFVISLPLKVPAGGRSHGATSGANR